MPRLAALLALCAGAAVLVACAPGDGADALEGRVHLPPAGGLPDYQLGGAYPPAADVTIVGRDREAEPAPGTYSICYVNGFQTQPGERDLWDDDLLVTIAGEPLADPDWPDEFLLDTSTPDTRARIVDVVGGWITGCADAGFDAVEFDNLDSFTRSEGALTIEDNISVAVEFVRIAHAAGLAAGQKNAAEFAERLQTEAGFDFAVVEECAAYRECPAYTDVYGAAVISIEYTDNLPRPWAEVCADAETPPSVVLRDRDLVTPDHPAHVAEHC